MPAVMWFAIKRNMILHSTETVAVVDRTVVSCCVKKSMQSHTRMRLFFSSPLPPSLPPSLSLSFHGLLVGREAILKLATWCTSNRIPTRRWGKQASKQARLRVLRCRDATEGFHVRGTEGPEENKQLKYKQH